MTTDSTAPLVFKGLLCLSSDGGSTYTDVSDELTKAVLHFTKDVVEIPATAGQPAGARGGGASASLEIGYLSVDGSGGSIFPMLWATAATAAGTLMFKLLERDGGESPTNPLWVGTVIITGAAVGGDAEALSTDSQTFPCDDVTNLTLTEA